MTARIARIGALGLALSLLLPWYGVDRPAELGPDVVNGWQALARLDALLFTAAIVALLAPLLLPQRWAWAAAAACGLGAAALVVYELVDGAVIGPVATAVQDPEAFLPADATRAGPFVALIAAVVLGAAAASRARRPAPRAWPSALRIVAGLTALAAVLRFAALGEQSYWYDEFAAIEVVRHGLGTAVDVYMNTESTPPLYYVIAWPWTQFFGSDEVVVRSLSALFGTLTVPVTFLAGRQLAGARAGLIAAALVAVNPTLFWYSQEARAYALLVLLAAVTLWALGRALRAPTRRNVALWSLACALALLTHYFALFLVAVEAVVLAVRALRERPGALVGAIGLPVVMVGLVALADAQGGGERANFIATIPLSDRVEAIGKELASANTLVINENTGLPRAGIGWLTAAVVVLAIAAAVTVTVRRRRASGAALALLLGAGALLIPLVLTQTGADYLLDRNLLAAWIALAIAFAAALTALPRWACGAALAVVLGAGLATNLDIATTPGLQRADWRDGVAVLGEREAGRAIVVTPSFARGMIPYYGTSATALPAEGIRTSEISVIGNFTIDGQYPQLAGFAVEGARQVPQVGVVALRAPAPVVLTPASLTAAGIDPRSVLAEPSARAREWFPAYVERVRTWRRALAEGDPSVLATPDRASVDPPPADIPTAAATTRAILAADSAGSEWAAAASDDAARERFEEALARVPGVPEALGSVIGP